MKKCAIVFLFFLSILNANVFAQDGDRFSLEAYHQFLLANQGLTFEDLREMYPVPVFLENSPASFSNALFADSVFRYYQFTDDEINAVETNGFMVSDRIRYKSFGEAFMTIYKRDLPVYVSSDAILHAIHISYSNILSTIEEGVLFHSIDSLLNNLHGELSSFETKYGDNPDMENSLKDYDVYLTIPRILLGNDVAPFYESNQERIDDVLEFINAEQFTAYPLFSDVERNLDFSQFTVRGHYTQSEKLGKYFKAMMWLGRTELYLITPDAVPYSSLSEEKRDSIAQRQTITSYLIEEALKDESSTSHLNDIDELISFLVGESDNVIVDHLRYLKDLVGIEDASSLTDMDVYKSFRDALIEEPFADQNILSQVLVQDPVNTDGIKPASAFMLLGQRFIIDSYILGNVVFDKISSGARRMLPKSADAMFALGNDHALKILEEDLQNYGYSLDLAALRYLVDSFEPEYWQQSFFNLWLNVVRQLNLPGDLTTLPKFTQTEAWSNKTINTQLAAWAQIRHDNLLYAKQSYTGGPVCEFPYSYVEPNPEFFEAVATLASFSKTATTSLEAIPDYLKSFMNVYFDDVQEISETLKDIAQNQIDGIENTDDQIVFLQEMMHESFSGCLTTITGWYKDLYFTGETGLLKEDFIVADVHTSPFNEWGDIVGWVLHVGTGPLNLATIVTQLPDGKDYVFVGPVMSFYEQVSVNFKRLTDEEWVQTFEGDATMSRPEFTDSYLVNSEDYYYDYRYFIPVSTEEPSVPSIPQTIELSQNYPNPFNAGTLINFRIPARYTSAPVKLEIFNIQGQRIQTLLDSNLSSGNYSVRWDSEASSGTYFYQLTVGAEVLSNKMLLLK